MSVRDYVFNIGDEVITVDGERGVITDICDCEECQKRGFSEPSWVDEDGEETWLTDYDFEHGFASYYKIGKYYFSPLRMECVTAEIANYESLLEKMRKRLAFMESLIREDATNVDEQTNLVEQLAKARRERDAG